MGLSLAVAAHKGGAGKTLLVANLAAELAAGGQRVLAVDADGQGALGAALGVQVTKPTLYEVLAGTATPAAAVEATTQSSLDLLPADLDLAGVEVQLPGRAGWQAAVRRALEPLRRDYDLLLVDTPPGLGVLAYAALVAGDAVLLVCPVDFLAVRVLGSLLDTIARAGEQVAGLRPLGIVPTFTGTRTRHEADALAELERRHGPLLLPAVPRRVVVADAALAGQPLHTYAPYSEAGEAFALLAKEVLRRAQAFQLH